MVQLKKCDLAFMDIYQLWANKEQAFQFEGNKDNKKIIVSQNSDKGLLITEFDYQVTDNFNFNFDTDIFVSLIKSLKNETDIIITEKGIEFVGSKYDIKNYNILFEDITPFLDKVKNSSNNKINLIDIDKFNFIKNSIGADGLDTVSYQNSYFVTSDRMNFTSFGKTSFLYEKEFYFSSDLFILFNIMNIKEKDIDVYGEFYSCKINDTYVLIMKKQYNLPNMFDDRIVGMYNHNFYFEVDKNEFNTILNRMFIVAKNNKETRIYLELKNQELIIQNTDTQFAKETIKVKYSEEIEGIKIPVSVNYLLKIINQLEGKIIKCFCSNDIDSFVAMKVEDETHNNFYALNLLEG